MRLTKTELESLTKLRLPSAQVRWFKRHFGVDVERDTEGVIMTKATVEALVAKKCGLFAKGDARPLVKLMKGV